MLKLSWKFVIEMSIHVLRYRAQLAQILALTATKILTYTIQDNATVKPPCKFGGFIG